MVPKASTSIPKIAPASGVPNTDANSSLNRIHPKRPSELVGQGRASLQSRSFSTGRAAEKMRDERANEDERRHPHRDGAFWVMDFVEDEIVAGFNRGAEVPVHQPDQKPCQRQQRDQPLVVLASICGDDQGPDQQCRCAPAHQADEDGDGRPAKKVAQDAEDFRCCESA